jgi:putative spermidine/putrescine transport system substrate-binding protein
VVVTGKGAARQKGIIMRSNRLIAGLTFLTIGTLLASCSATGGGEGSGSEEQVELVVAGNPGPMEGVMRDEVIPAFEDEHPNVSVTYVPGVSSETIASVKASRDAPTIDVAIVESNSQEDGRKAELWEPIDFADAPNTSRIQRGERAVDDTGVPVYVLPYGISYSKSYLEENNLDTPTAWNDLSDASMAGHLSVCDINSAFGRGLLILLANANGGSTTDIEPGMDAYLEVATNQRTLFKSSATQTQALQDGSAGLAVWSRDRHLQLTKDSDDYGFVIPKGGTYLQTSFANVVHGSSHVDVATEFIDFLLDDMPQQAIAGAFLNPVTDVELSSELSESLELDESEVLEVKATEVQKELPSWFDWYNREVAPNVGSKL